MNDYVKPLKCPPKPVIAKVKKVFEKIKKAKLALNEWGIPAPPALPFALPEIPNLIGELAMLKIRANFKKQILLAENKLKLAHKKDKPLIDQIPDQLIERASIKQGKCVAECPTK